MSAVNLDGRATPFGDRDGVCGDATRTAVMLAVSLLIASTLMVVVALADSPALKSVTYIPAADVKAGFDKGAVLLDAGSYMVHASRREAPGMAEVHDKDTDIIYVLEGSAVFITGGSVVDGRSTAPDELRGASIDGGTTRRLVRGDVVVVPNGTPHWFRDVQPPLLYYVVKVR